MKENNHIIQGFTHPHPDIPHHQPAGVEGGGARQTVPALPPDNSIGEDLPRDIWHTSRAENNTISEAVKVIIENVIEKIAPFLEESFTVIVSDVPTAKAFLINNSWFVGEFFFNLIIF